MHFLAPRRSVKITAERIATDILKPVPAIKKRLRESLAETGKKPPDKPTPQPAERGSGVGLFCTPNIHRCEAELQGNERIGVHLPTPRNP